MVTFITEHNKTTMEAEPNFLGNPDKPVSHSQKNTVLLVIGVIIIIALALIAYKLFTKKTTTNDPGNGGDCNNGVVDNSCATTVDCSDKCLAYDMTLGACVCTAGNCTFVANDVGTVPYGTVDQGIVVEGRCNLDSDCNTFCMQYDLSRGDCQCQNDNCVYTPYSTTNVPYQYARSSDVIPNQNKLQYQTRVYGKDVMVEENFLNHNGKVPLMIENVNRPYGMMNKLPSGIIGKDEDDFDVFSNSPNGLKTPLARFQ